MTSTRRTSSLTMAVFAMQAMSFGAWLALIPFVKEDLGLSKGELALALLGFPVALIPTMKLASGIVTRVGPRKALMGAFPMLALVVTLPLFSTGPVTLFLCLAVLGLVIAFLEIGMNVYAGRLEKERKVTVMSRCHGFWAVGIMIGSGLMTLLAWAPPLAGLLSISVASAACGVIAARSLPHLGAPPGTPPPPRRSLRQAPVALVPIALCTLAVTMTEGAMSDWAAVYLAERLPPGATHAGIAVSIFAGFLAAGRFAGDALKTRFGAVLLARGAILLAVTGLMCLVLPLPVVTAYVGFALLGTGCAVAFPLGVSAAAALDDTYEGENIALTSMVAVTGFLIGPPMIGGLAELQGLRLGLAALLPFLLAGFVLAPRLEPVPVSDSAGDSGRPHPVSGRREGRTWG